MIKSVKFRKDWRCFKEGELYEFRPGINLLVGDQGSGKSSLISIFKGAIQNRDEVRRVAEIKGDQIELRIFDFEADNPRVKGHIEHVADVAMRFQAHGDCVLAVFDVIKDESTKKAFVLDEPDMALSVRSVYRVIETLKKTCHQVLAAVHNPLLIQAFPEVLSLEHKKWMTSEEFLESQKL